MGFVSWPLAADWRAAGMKNCDPCRTPCCVPLCRCMFCEPGRRHVVLHLHGLRSFQLALRVLHLFAVSFLAEKNLAGLEVQ